MSTTTTTIVTEALPLQDLEKTAGTTETDEFTTDQLVRQKTGLQDDFKDAYISPVDAVYLKSTHLVTGYQSNEGFDVSGADPEQRVYHAEATMSLKRNGTIDRAGTLKSLKSLDGVVATDTLGREGSLRRRLNTEKREDGTEETFVDPRGIENNFTFRGALVGALLGCIVVASNMYLGFKSGWNFGASLFGALGGFVIVKALSKLPKPIGDKGSDKFFGPKENCTIQSSATAAGGLSAGFVSTIPVMYRLGLTKAPLPSQDWGSLYAWTVAAGFYGTFFAVPLRTYFVIRNNLPFPTPTAAAEICISLHDSSNPLKATEEANKKAKIMALTFLIAYGFTIGAWFLPCILGDLHIFYWIGKSAGWPGLMAADQVWRWYFTWDFAFFGAGMMTPFSTVYSFFLGELVMAGIAGPIMLANGVTQTPWGWGAKFSTQQFFIWSGVFCMLCSSFTDLFCQWRALWNGIKGGIDNAVDSVKRLIGKTTKEREIIEDIDPVPKHDRIPTWEWVAGIALSTVLTILVLDLVFGVAWYYSVLGCFLSFMLAFVGLQAAGETDINPTGTVAKISQLLFAAFPGTTQQKQAASLMQGCVTASAASQAVDMVGDLKTGNIVGATPKSQFYAALFGTVAGIIVSVPIFVLYTTAYPCIISAEIEAQGCEFALPAVHSWEALTLLLTTGGTSVPISAWITAGCFAGATIISNLVRNLLIPVSWKPYWINFNGIGLGFITATPEVPIAMACGWIFSAIWKRVSPVTHTKYLYASSAGEISGAGIGGLTLAIFSIAKVPGDQVTWGCIP